MTADVETAAARRLSPSPPPAPPTPELYELMRALEVVRSGDFSVRLPSGQDGVVGKISVLFNEIVGANQNMAQQLERIGKAVGEQGRTRQRVKFGISTASWGDMESSVNTLIDDLVWPTTEVTRVISAVAAPSARRSCWSPTPWHRATCCRRRGSMSTVGRSEASSCAQPPSSTQ